MRSLRERQANFEANLQYLAHALRVSGAMFAANEIEDLLRSSLVYSVAERDAPEDAQKLVRLCRAYLEQMSEQRPLVALADGTGFSTPTIRALLAGAIQGGLGRAEEWDPKVLFGEDLAPLTERVRLIADLPEIFLGENEHTGVFNAARIAAILRDWVNGATLPQLVTQYGNSTATPEARHAQFVQYLQSKLTSLASWGMGALEKVALRPTADSPIEGDAGHVPAMILYGVRDREAVWLRMAGLTRETATAAAQIWKLQQRPDPTSFDDVREWISSVTEDQWSEATRGTAFIPGDVSILWERALR